MLRNSVKSKQLRSKLAKPTTKSRKTTTKKSKSLPANALQRHFTTHKSSTTTQQLFTTKNLSFSTSTTTIDAQSDQVSESSPQIEYNTTLTPEQRQQWCQNKLRKPIVDALHFFLIQFKLIPQPTITMDDSTNKIDEPIDSNKVILQSLLDHQLLLPIDAPDHPYTGPHNKQDVINDMMNKAFVPLKIVPENYKKLYKLGTIPPVQYNSGFITDTYDKEMLTQAHLNVEKLKTQNKTDIANTITTIVEMFSLCLVSSGYSDLQAMLSDVENMPKTPSDESHLTSFDDVSIKIWKPNNQDEDKATLRSQIASVQYELESNEALDVYDHIAAKFRRFDVMQLYLHTYGGKIPDIGVYRSYLVQCAAQSLLTEHYLQNSFDKVDQITSDSPTGSANKQQNRLYFSTLAQNLTDLDDHRREMEKVQQQLDRQLLSTVHQALPLRSYPVLEADQKGVLPQPPEGFVDPTGFQHELIELTMNDHPVEQFAALITGQKITGLRDIFLRHFRHDITSFYNFVENDTFHKFRSELNSDAFTDSDLSTIQGMIYDLWLQNQEDQQFKQQFVEQELLAFRKKDLNQTIDESAIKSDKLVYKHILSSKYPVFAQKCYSLVMKEVNEQVTTMKKELLVQTLQSQLDNAEASPVGDEQTKTEQVQKK